MQLALWVPSLLVLIFLIVGGVLAIIVIGVRLLLVTVPAAAGSPTSTGAMAARVLGTPIPNQYRPTRAVAVARVTGWASDPMTWRDLAWLLAAMHASASRLSLVAVLLLIMIVTGALWWYGIEPIMRGRAAMDRWMLSYGHTEVLEQRVQVLTETRADAVDHSAAELRRIERDLHDGAQARLVALSMSLGMAD